MSTADPYIYPVAQADIPYRSPVRVDGLRAWPCTLDEANGEAVDPSYRGDSVAYPAGHVARVRPVRGVVG